MIIGLAIGLTIFVIWSIISLCFAFSDEFDGELISTICKIYWYVLLIIVSIGFIYWVSYSVSESVICTFKNNDYPQCVKENKNANEERTN